MIEKINDIFRNRRANIIGNHKKSAVMILLVEEEGRTCILFEVRSSKLRHQPGDICLPGGRIEESENPEDAAVREVIEELNVNKDDIELIGEMDYFVSPYGSIMYPYIGRLKSKKINPSRNEVDHVFKVPLEFFMENEPLLYPLEIGPHLKEDFPYHLIRGGKEYKFSKGILKEYFYKYKDYVIWGFTAMIIKSFIDILKNELDGSFSLDSE